MNLRSLLTFGLAVSICTVHVGPLAQRLATKYYMPEYNGSA